MHSMFELEACLEKRKARMRLEAKAINRMVILKVTLRPSETGARVFIKTLFVIIFINK